MANCIVDGLPPAFIGVGGMDRAAPPAIEAVVLSRI